MRLTGKEYEQEEPIVSMLSKMTSLQAELVRFPQRGDWIYVVTEEPNQKVLVKYVIVNNNPDKEHKVTVEINGSLLLLKTKYSINKKKTIKAGSIGDKTKLALRYIVFRPSVERLVDIIMQKTQLRYMDILTHLIRLNVMKPQIKDDILTSLLRIYSIVIDRKVYRGKSFYSIPSKYKWFAELREAFGYEKDDSHAYFSGLWERYYYYGLTVKETLKKMEVKYEE